MSSLDYWDSIRIRALASVVDPDTDDVLIEIFEWYSKEFSTPLHFVYELPVDEVLHHYFRWIYRNMDGIERHNAAIWLLETPEERAARAAADKKDDEDFMAKAAAVNAKKKQPSEAQKAFDRMQKKFLDNIDQFKAKAAPLEKKLLKKEMPEASLPASKPKDEEEVVVTYMSEADFEAELDKPSGPAPKPRKTKK